MGTKTSSNYHWSLPKGIEVSPDKLQARLDFYEESTVLYLIDKDKVTTRMVSTRDVALAFLHEIPLGSGLLPENALWWLQGKEGVELAMWRPPKVWLLALQLEAFKPPRRMKLPMPGLIFVCLPASPPRVYAAKKKPKRLQDKVYHAPLFNVFTDGHSCPGNNKYPQNVVEIPESFMISFFTTAANHAGRSKKYPKDLLQLWNEIEGKNKYPLDDLVPMGEVKDIIK
jgi:PRTRC genetic system protein B